MSRLYLVTGFLGAGKTTFLKQFIRLFQGQKIQLIVNEFGKEGVDGTLLADLGAYLKEIAGGSVFCSCRLDQFEKVLRESADLQPDVILVEASGLSDPTGVRKLFSQTERFPHITYMGGVCLVDAVRFPKLYATARVCKKQLAASDVVVLNKCDRATPEQLAQTQGLLHGQRPDIAVLATSFGQITADILQHLSGVHTGQDTPEWHTADVSLRKQLLTIAPTISRYALIKFLEMFLEETYRTKGFIRTTDGLMLVNCVGNVPQVERFSGSVPDESVGHLVVLSGEGMRMRKAVQEAVKWYAEYIIAVE